MHPTSSVPAHVCSYFQCLSSQSNFIPIPLFSLSFFLLDIVFTALILISIESSECSLSDCFYSIITSEKMTKLKEIPIAKLFVLYHPQTVLCGCSTSASRVLCHLSVNTKHCGCFQSVFVCSHKLSILACILLFNV